MDQFVDHDFSGSAALAGIAQIVGGEVCLVQQTGAVCGVAAAGHPALNELQGIAAAEGQHAVVRCTVVHHRLHGLRRPGGLHDGLMLAAVVEFDVHAAGLDILADVVPGIENAAGAVGVIAPGFCAVCLFCDDLRLAGPEGNDRHGCGKRDLDGGGITVFPRQHVYQAGETIRHFPGIGIQS